MNNTATRKLKAITTKTTTTGVKRKKRVLSSTKEPITSSRQLRQKSTPALSISVSKPSSINNDEKSSKEPIQDVVESQEKPTQDAVETQDRPTSPQQQASTKSTKRSILTLQQKAEKKPVRRKRKLNSSQQPVLIDEPGDDLALSKYLDTSIIPEPVIIGAPTKKLKIKDTPKEEEKEEQPKEQPEEQPEEPKLDTLDLSQHSILPNDTYVAHLPKKRSCSISDDNASTTTASTSTFYDALSEFEEPMQEDSIDMKEGSIDMKEDSIDMQSTIPTNNNNNNNNTSSFWSSLIRPFFQQ